MSQLLENTYLAYEQFMEGELNQYDLMSLIEEGIISGEVLESMLVESGLVDVEEDEEELEEGEKWNKVKSIGKKALIGGAIAGTLAGGASALHDEANRTQNAANLAKDLEMRYEHPTVKNLYSLYHKKLQSQADTMRKFDIINHLKNLKNKFN